MYYDLHTHTCYSDGTLTPAALIARAHAAGVKVLALTDHDVTAGIDAARVAAQACGLALVAGVEISVTWKQQTLHVLGLGVDTANAALQAGLAQLRAAREVRAQDIDRRLARHGVVGAYEGARAYAHGPIISRTHFAQHLVAAGVAADFRKAFKQFLAKGAPGYAPVAWVALETAVAWIRAAGGQAVLAHPARYKLSATQLRALLNAFRECGGVGIEVVSGSHSRDDALRFAHHAHTLDLLASAGSDYHGPENAWMEVGRLPELPAGCKPIWHDWPLPHAA